MMRRRADWRQDGFTLVELMVTLLVFMIVIVAATNIFSGLLTQFKQQSRIAETNIEGIIGLELMRYDLEQAGNGIPWQLNGVNYSEVPAGNTGAAYDDDSNPPKAMIIADGGAPETGWRSPGQVVGSSYPGSDVLVIKATNVATSDAAQKWTHIIKMVPAQHNILREWGTMQAENPSSSDYAIVINPGTSTSQRLLMNDGGVFSVQLNDNSFSFKNNTNTTTFPFEPFRDTDNDFIVYGIKPDDGSAPRMPFNRADYYISASNVPSVCAASELPEAQRTTGVLYKSVIINSTSGTNAGKRGAPMPILNCVADMQAVAMLDTNNDGVIDVTTGDLTTMDANTIRTQLKEIKVYILAQEGQKDPTFTFNNFTGASPGNTCPGNCATCIAVGENCTGSIFDLSKISANSADTNDYLHYRWKVYTIAVTPYNIR